MVSSFALHLDLNIVGFFTVRILTKRTEFSKYSSYLAMSEHCINCKCLSEYCACQKTGNWDHKIWNWFCVCVCLCWSRKWKSAEKGKLRIFFGLILRLRSFVPFSWKNHENGVPAPEEDFLIVLLLKPFLLTHTLALSGELYPVIQKRDWLHVTVMW